MPGRVLWLCAALSVLALGTQPASAHSCPPAPPCAGSECPQALPCAHQPGAPPSATGSERDGALPELRDERAPAERFVSGVAVAAGAMDVAIPLGAFALAAGQASPWPFAAGVALALAGFALGAGAVRSGIDIGVAQIVPAGLLIAGALLMLPRAWLGRALPVAAFPLALACGYLFEMYFAPLDAGTAAGLGMAAVPAAALALGLGLSRLAGYRWFAIAQRILASWILAGAIMMVALILRAG